MLLYHYLVQANKQGIGAMNTIHPTRLVQTYEVVEIVEIDAARLLTLGPSLLQDSSTSPQ